MSDLGDFYQRLVSLPNLLLGFDKETEARKVLADMKSILDNVKITIDKVDKSIAKHGQKDYAKSIKNRCDHLFKRTQDIYENQIQPKTNQAVVVPGDDDTINSLRDLYHYMYYTLFYLSRYTLVMAGEFDNGHHSQMAKSLNNYVKIKNSANSMTELADLLKSRLQEFSTKRDKADYIINSSAIKDLEVVASITTDFNEVKELWEKSNKL